MSKKTKGAALETAEETTREAPVAPQEAATGRLLTRPMVRVLNEGKASVTLPSGVLGQGKSVDLEIQAYGAAQTVISTHNLTVEHFTATKRVSESG